MEASRAGTLKTTTLWAYRIAGGYRVIADIQRDRMVILAVEPYNPRTARQDVEMHRELRCLGRSYVGGRFSGKAKGLTLNEDQALLSVAGTGFEPATSGL